ncbi:hypothetical protein DES53_10525 [Roseimicrobium gellanilyticum]|uniref:Uncharacterized protein n=2 Tax=Roseimicrobium gellanilyticum TaxID=748857 RepID=A0A366HM19_9BACT|nr:hypothetical protein DES53_10525 [Roseimicrobium gellanilyticum]
MKNSARHPLKPGTLWPLLMISVAMNLAGLAWGLHQHLRSLEDEETRLSSPGLHTSAPRTTASQVVPSFPEKKISTSPTPVRKFHWSELEAQDFDTYIARLREVGCPEATIKSIVLGDLKTNSISRRAELERKILRSPDWSPPRGVSREAYLASQLRKLDRELELTAADLTNSTPDSDGQPAIAGTGVQGRPPVHYPAVMGDVTFQPATSSASEQTSGDSKPVSYVSPGVVETSPDALASIQEIQQNFVQDIGGPNQDVEDPQYESNWRTAQWKADQIFRARHGWAAHNDLVRAAALKAYEAARAANP